MRNTLLAIFLLASFSMPAQNSSNSLKDLGRRIEEQRKRLDSQRKATDSILLASSKRLDSIQWKEDLQRQNRNFSSFLRDYNERKRKDQQRLIVRIIFLVAMLVLAIIGWRRKKKPTV